QAVCTAHLEGEPMDWNLEELHRAALTIYPVPASITPESMAQDDERDQIELLLVKGALEIYQQHVTQFTDEWMAQAEKFVLLNTLDQYWQRHLTDLDVLREGIGLVGYGGRTPLVEYQRQSFDMWQALQVEIKTKVARDIYLVAPPEQQPQQRRRLQLQRQVSNVQTGRGAMPVPVPAAATDSQRPQPVATNQPGRPEPIRNVGKFDNVGMNDLCPCGSGKKFKKCHYLEIRGQRETVAPNEVKQRAPTRRKRR
ncbi:MAG: hypothetical protein EHM39_06635, partial [Chloroflexi bacterium]